MFSKALEDYNSKQRRSDRQIENYYEKIRTSKQEKLFYEIVVQVGNCSDMDTTSENGELAKKILDKYINDFVERNPNLYVFSAHLHMDEATPHLHIDYIPFSSSNKRGLETKNSLKGALLQQGFKGGTRSETELTQWQNSEKERLAEIMLEHGIEWEQKGTHKEHLSVLDYKKEVRADEIKELDNQIENKNEKILQLESEEEQLNSKLDKVNKLTNKTKKELKKHTKVLKKINPDVWRLDEDESLQLPPVTIMTTAKHYRDKIAYPLVSGLKEEIRNLTIQFVNYKDKYGRLNDSYKRMEDKYYSLSNRYEEQSEKVKMFDLLVKIVGMGKIKVLVKDYDEEIEQEKKVNKNKDSR